MKKLLWQTRTQVVADSIRTGKLLPSANGGNAYDVHAAEALMKNFQVEVSSSAILKKEETLWKYWHRMRTDIVHADVIIREPYPIVFGSLPKGIPCVGMIHHIDDKLGKSSLKHWWYFDPPENDVCRNLDLVVTVSSYWREYLEALGCRNVKVIYNAFNPADYEIT